jgi:hypothetical protein
MLPRGRVVGLAAPEFFPAKLILERRLVLIADAVPALAIPDGFVGLLHAALCLAGFLVPK